MLEIEQIVWWKVVSIICVVMVECKRGGESAVTAMGEEIK